MARIVLVPATSPTVTERVCQVVQAPVPGKASAALTTAPFTAMSSGRFTAVPLAYRKVRVAGPAVAAVTSELHVATGHVLVVHESGAGVAGVVRLDHASDDRGVLGLVDGARGAGADPRAQPQRFTGQAAHPDEPWSGRRPAPR